MDSYDNLNEQDLDRHPLSDLLQKLNSPRHRQPCVLLWSLVNASIVTQALLLERLTNDITFTLEESSAVQINDNPYLEDTYQDCSSCPSIDLDQGFTRHLDQGSGCLI